MVPALGLSAGLSRSGPLFEGSELGEAEGGGADDVVLVGEVDDGFVDGAVVEGVVAEGVDVGFSSPEPLGAFFSASGRRNFGGPVSSSNLGLVSMCFFVVFDPAGTQLPFADQAVPARTASFTVNSPCDTPKCVAS
jgi:hypothetical protein